MEFTGDLLEHCAAKHSTAPEDATSTVGFSDAIELGGKGRVADFFWEIVNGKACQDLSKARTDNVIVAYGLPVLKPPPRWPGTVFFFWRIV